MKSYKYINVSKWQGVYSNVMRSQGTNYAIHVNAQRWQNNSLKDSDLFMNM